MELCTAILPPRCSVPPPSFSAPPTLHGGFRHSLPLPRFTLCCTSRNQGGGGRLRLRSRLRAGVATDEGSSCDVLDDSRMIRVCDKLIGVFMVDKPSPTDWRRLLAFSKEWDTIRPHFFTRCHDRAVDEADPAMKEKLLRLARKLKEVSFN